MSTKPKLELVTPHVHKYGKPAIHNRMWKRYCECGSFIATKEYPR